MHYLQNTLLFGLLVLLAWLSWDAGNSIQELYEAPLETAGSVLCEDCRAVVIEGRRLNDISISVDAQLLILPIRFDLPYHVAEISLGASTGRDGLGTFIGLYKHCDEAVCRYLQNLGTIANVSLTGPASLDWEKETLFPLDQEHPAIPDDAISASGSAEGGALLQSELPSVDERFIVMNSDGSTGLDLALSLTVIGDQAQAGRQTRLFRLASLVLLGGAVAAALSM